MIQSTSIKAADRHTPSLIDEVKKMIFPRKTQIGAANQHSRTISRVEELPSIHETYMKSSLNPKTIGEVLSSSIDDYTEYSVKQYSPRVDVSRDKALLEAKR